MLAVIFTGMPTIFCSLNLVDLIGKDRLSAIADTQESDPRANWHARLFYISGRKCILWTNKATLYSFVRVNVAKKDLIDLPQVLLSCLFTQLKHDGFYNDNQQDYWLENMSRLSFKKTDNDKRVIGSMNDFIDQIKTGIKYGSRALKQVDDISLASYLNTIPMGMIGYRIPIEAFGQAISGHVT